MTAPVPPRIAPFNAVEKIRDAVVDLTSTKYTILPSGDSVMSANLPNLSHAKLVSAVHGETTDADES